MKKLLSFTAIFILSQFLLFAQNDSQKILNWEVAISTGIPVHNSKPEATKSEILVSPSFKRIIFGANADVVFNITEPLKLFAGTDTFCEFIWEQSNHYNSLDYSFYTGIKVFPNLAGLNFSVAYVLGSKANFYKTEEVSNTSENTAWGNGFRIAVEYDFFYGEEAKIYPIVGGYYRFMPRGNYEYDHILAAYVGLRF